MTFEEDFSLIKNLTEIQACTGYETKIGDFISKTVEPYCDKIENDVLGNLFCHVNGKKATGDSKLKIMLDAHMDEIGMIVRFIDKNGFIRFSQVGGQNPRILPGQTVSIFGNSGKEITGIIGEKAIHLIEQEERKKTSKLEDLFIDIGMKNKEEVKNLVSVGDYIVLKQTCTALNNSERIVSKALDDRAGCFILIKLIIEFSQIKDKLDKDLIFLFASQEEIGVRGATVGSYKISPDLGIAVEVTHAIDYPGVSEDKHYESKLGGGASISIGPNLFPKLTKLLIDTANENDIPFVLEAEERPTPTDARAIQVTKSGIPTALVCAPLRYMHTNIEMVEYNDLIHVFSLLKAFLLKDLNSSITL